jgi:hypothetical protein
MTIVTDSPSVRQTSLVGLGNKQYCLEAGLISEELWGRLTRRVAKKESVNLSLAERIVDQALGYLRLCANPVTAEEDAGLVGPYSPSDLVDPGWENFVLYSRHYLPFCDDLAGHYIHHVPYDEAGVDYDTDNIGRTVAAMHYRGIPVDKPLWTGYSECNDVGGGEFSYATGGEDRHLRY